LASVSADDAPPFATIGIIREVYLFQEPKEIRKAKLTIHFAMRCFHALVSARDEISSSESWISTQERQLPSG